MKLKCGHIDNQCGLPSAPPKKGKMIAGDLRKCLLPGWHSPGTRAGPPSLNAELRGVQSPRTWCLSDSLLQPLIAGGQRCNCQCTAARLPLRTKEVTPAGPETQCGKEDCQPPGSRPPTEPATHLTARTPNIPEQEN